MGEGNFDGEEVQVIFNRDMLMNESDIITNCQNSQGILSDETIISMHPWVDDPQAEMERLEKQKQKERVEFESSMTLLDSSRNRTQKPLIRASKAVG